MEIYAVKITRTEYPYNHYFATRITWCCDKMREAWLTAQATFGNVLFNSINQCAKVRLNQLQCRMLGQVGIKIDCCPYCGLKIKINITEQGKIDYANQQTNPDSF